MPNSINSCNFSYSHKNRYVEGLKMWLLNRFILIPVTMTSPALRVFDCKIGFYSQNFSSPSIKLFVQSLMFCTDSLKRCDHVVHMTSLDGHCLWATEAQAIVYIACTLSWAPWRQWTPCGCGLSPPGVGPPQSMRPSTHNWIRSDHMTNACRTDTVHVLEVEL